MKLHALKPLLAMTLCLLLAGGADAQGRGKKKKKKGGGGKQKSKQKAKQSQKAQKAAAQKEKEALQKKTQQLKAWNEKEKARVIARQAQIKAQGKTLPSELGPAFRSHCASCHAVPDPSFPNDSSWLSSLATTRCRDLPPELRDGLLSYLSAAAEFRPVPVTAFAEPAPGQASLTSNIEGEVFLRSETGTTFRFLWGPGQAGEKRVLAPGKYTLTGYRVARGPWLLSSSGGDAAIAVRADQDLPLKLQPTVKLELRLAPSPVSAKPNAAILELSLRDARGQALSVYRGGQRVPLPFQVETEAGAAQHGVMAYTSEGRATANLEVPLGQPAWARVDLPFDFPFPIEGPRRVALPVQR